jgi:UDP-3-O-[3-hydroxymyristoyl] glucosamine N-acyltransferase
MQERKSYTLQEIAELTSCQLIGDPNRLITGISDLEAAGEQDASFYAISHYEKKARHEQQMKASKAGAIFIHTEQQHFDGQNFLLSKDPSRAFQTLVEKFHLKRSLPSGFRGIHPTAVVDASAEIGDNVTLCPYVVIDEGVKIGSNTFIGAGSYIGPGSVIGHSCLIHARVVVREDCQIGNRVIIQPGAVIGSCGFGYTLDNQGHHEKLNQVGNVKLEDDVEIGANSTIDRARFKQTSIGKGSKLDNLVQIGHGVKLGAHNLIAGQSGIAGSTITNAYCVFGGQVAVAGHLKLGRIIVAGKSGISKSLSDGIYGGIPAQPIAEYNRNQVHLRKIASLYQEVKELKEKIEAINEDLHTNR